MSKKVFFDFDIDSCIISVKENDVLNTGNHELQFIMAPMVHWPEVMVTYDKTTQSLFSADAFGSFGAINGNLFDNEVNWEKDYLDEARRYYTNIVGKYGMQVQMLLKNIERDKYTSIIHEELNKLGIEFERYKERWNKLSRSIETVNKDVENIHITTEKIINTKKIFDKTLDKSFFVYYIRIVKGTKPNDQMLKSVWEPEVQTPSYILSPLDSGSLQS